MTVLGVIPARLAATRLPNKPLLDIAGKPMIRHVWERACRSLIPGEIVVATPDPEIERVCLGFGARVVMTRADHPSGTDRIAEVTEKIPCDVIVNIQGDEPMLDPSVIDMAARAVLEDGSVQMASLMCPCPPEDLDNPACVKVVCDLNGYALYFSRSRVPFPRNDAAAPVMQHVGLYAYRSEFVRRFAGLPPTPLERTEGLEQLRALESGCRIRMVATENAPISVDTEDDLRRVRQMMG
jgi:3-deoxy-manno-octulosonate cytidylyltransferase (CMP-KDO synthetase)